jgi:hypothetical protein
MTNLVNVRDFIACKVGDDWAPAFKKAIQFAVENKRGGVFVPSDPEPYLVAKPEPDDGPMSIDLCEKRDFALVGDGPGSVIRMFGSGRNSDWSMIHIGGNADNLVVRDLYLDGNDLPGLEGVTNVAEHTHLIRIGRSAVSAGGARNVKILRCTLARAHGDGVAILPAGDAPDGAGGGGEIVSDVQIAHCSFISNNRSGISNQRFTERIQILYNHFEGTSDQDIDFEPTTGTLDSGPRGYLIMGNVFVHSTEPASVTLSGVGPNIPALRNTFAYNQIYGGGLGMLQAENTSIVGNHIEGGALAGQAVVRMGGHLRGIRFAQNHIVRPSGAIPGQLLSVHSDPQAMPFVSQPIDAAANTFTRPHHGLATGDGAVQFTTSETLPGGLAPNTDYWVISDNEHELRFATSPDLANAGIAIDITDAGVGVQTMAFTEGPPRRRRFRSGGDIDPDANTLSHTGHGLATGAGPVRVTTSPDGTPPGGLSAGIDYWVIRFGRDLLQLASSPDDARDMMPVDITDQGAGIQTVTLVGFPRGIDVQNNRFHAFTGDGGRSLVSFLNASESSFTGNEVHSYSGQEPTALKFETNGAGRPEVSGWDVTGNRFRGDANEAGTGMLSPAVMFSAVAIDVEDIRVCFNNFAGTAAQVMWNSGSDGAFVDVPMAIGNNGVGLPFTTSEGTGVTAVMIGGNETVDDAIPPASSSTAMYCGSGEPAFVARRGSIYMQTDGEPGTLLWVNNDNSAGWTQFG